MRTRDINTGTLGSRLASMAALAVLPLLVVGYARISLAQASEPKTFSSPAEASNALFQAVKNDDEQAVGAILGAGKEVTSSSDEVEDKLERERFSQKYQEMHRPDSRSQWNHGAVHRGRKLAISYPAGREERYLVLRFRYWYAGNPVPHSRRE